MTTDKEPTTTAARKWVRRIRTIKGQTWLAVYTALVTVIYIGYLFFYAWRF